MARQSPFFLCLPIRKRPGRIYICVLYNGSNTSPGGREREKHIRLTWITPRRHPLPSGSLSPLYIDDGSSRPSAGRLLGNMDWTMWIWFRSGSIYIYLYPPSFSSFTSENKELAGSLFPPPPFLYDHPAGSLSARYIYFSASTTAPFYVFFPSTPSQF